MRTLIIAILSLAIGAAAGFFGAARSVGDAVGAAAGAGIGTGLVTGICMITQAGRSTGLLTDEQISTLLTTAAQDFGAVVPAEVEATVSASACEEALGKLKATN